MQKTRAIQVLRVLNATAVLAVAAFSCWQLGRATEQDEKGVLVLKILDASTKEPVPARVELLDSEMRGHISPDAIPIGGD